MILNDYGFTGTLMASDASDDDKSCFERSGISCWCTQAASESNKVVCHRYLDQNQGTGWNIAAINDQVSDFKTSCGCVYATIILLCILYKSWHH